MKTNWLELTEEIVVETLLKPFEKKRKIAGVDITEKDDSKIISAIRTTEDIYSLKKRFNDAGVPLIAVLPKKVFFEIIKCLPFYVFKEISETGEVKADVENFLLKSNKKMLSFFIISLILFLAGLWTLGFFIKNDFIRIPFRIETAIWTICSLLFMLGSVLASETTSITTLFGENSDESGLNFFQYVAVIAFLFPVALVLGLYAFIENFVISEHVKKNFLFPHRLPEGEGKVKIQLPPAPEHVKEILLKLDKLRVKVYPVIYETAFNVSVDKEEIEYWKSKIWPDPIFVSEDGKYILFHTFYGEIPQEMKFIQNIRKRVSQVTEEFLDSIN